MNKSISFSVFFAFFIIMSSISSFSFELDENLKKIDSPPDKMRLMGFKSNFPNFNKIAIAFINEKEKKMYAQVNDKLYGPYPALGKNTPFFAPNSDSFAFSVHTDNKDYFVVNGDTKKKYDGLGEIIFSPDGKKYAYKAQKGNKQLIILNDRELKEYDGIKNNPIFSPDGKRLAYIAFENRKDAYVICNKKKFGPFKNVKEIKFSPDSKKLGFIAFKDKGWKLYINNKESKAYKNLLVLKFSNKNISACVAQNFKDKLLILEDFKEHEPYKTVGEPSFNPQGDILSYPATKDQKWFMVVNKQEEFNFDKLGPITFSETGSSYGYTGINDKNPVMVINGKKMKGYVSVGLIKFSTDGKHYAYRAAIKNKGWLVVWDGKEGKSYFDVKQPIFNPEKNEIAYMAFKGKSVVMVKNHIEGKEYKSLGLPKYSPKGNHLAYHASEDEKKWIINIDDKETENSASLFIGKFPITFDSEKKLHSIGMQGFDFINFECVIK